MIHALGKSNEEVNTVSNKKDYTKFSKENVNEVVESHEDVTLTEIVEESDKTVTGIVTNCTRLNVRKNPNSTAPVVAVIDASTDLVVYVDEAAGDFFKICTASGIEGFCMKDYISLIP